MKSVKRLRWLVVLAPLAAACSPTSPGTTPADGGQSDSSGVTDAAAGGLTFQPSNVTLASVMAQMANAQDEEITGGCSSIGISTLDPARTCTMSPITMTTEPTTTGPQPVGLIVVKSLKIDANVAVLVEGEVPLVIVSLGDVTLESGASIQANSLSHVSYVGPGGFPAPTSGDEKGNGPGAGAAGNTSGNTSIGAGGGAFCGTGGPGGSASAAAAAYGSSDLRPLLGGSSGGTANGGGGAGGGAIQNQRDGHDLGDRERVHHDGRPGRGFVHQRRVLGGRQRRRHPPRGDHGERRGHPRGQRRRGRQRLRRRKRRVAPHDLPASIGSPGRPRHEQLGGGRQRLGRVRDGGLAGVGGDDLDGEPPGARSRAAAAAARGGSASTHRRARPR